MEKALLPFFRFRFLVNYQITAIIHIFRESTFARKDANFVDQAAPD